MSAFTVDILGFLFAIRIEVTGFSGIIWSGFAGRGSCLNLFRIFSPKYFDIFFFRVLKPFYGLIGKRTYNSHTEKIIFFWKTKPEQIDWIRWILQIYSIFFSRYFITSNCFSFSFFFLKKAFPFYFSISFNNFINSSNRNNKNEQICLDYSTRSFLFRSLEILANRAMKPFEFIFKNVCLQECENKIKAKGQNKSHSSSWIIKERNWDCFLIVRFLKP